MLKLSTCQVNNNQSVVSVPPLVSIARNSLAILSPAGVVTAGLKLPTEY